MPLALLTYPDERLLRNCRAVLSDADWDAVAAAVPEMLAVCQRERGYALAANQVGLDLALFVVTERAEGLPRAALGRVFVNPAFAPDDRRGTDRMKESCLSLPGLVSFVRRPAAGTLTYHTRDPDLVATMPVHGLFARVVQHELDHLAGRFYVDHLDPAGQSRRDADLWMERARGGDPQL